MQRRAIVAVRCILVFEVDAVQHDLIARDECEAIICRKTRERLEFTNFSGII